MKNLTGDHIAHSSSQPQNLTWIPVHPGLSDMVFWLAIIFYLDPGGWFHSTIGLGKMTSFLFFVIAWMVFMNHVFRFSGTFFAVFSHRNMRKYLVLTIIWLSYYLVYYSIFHTPMYDEDNLFLPILRTADIILQSLIVFPVFYFAQRSLRQFIVLFTATTVIVTVLYFLTIILNIPLVPINQFDRGYANLTRYIPTGTGIMRLAEYLAIVVIVLIFSRKKKLSKLDIWIIVSGVMVALMWTLAIIRREILGYFLITLIGLWIGGRVFNISYIKLAVRSVLIIPFLLVIFVLLAPSVTNTIGGALNTVAEVFVSGESSHSEIDRTRLFQTENAFLYSLAVDNILTGTGYTQLWYIQEGDAQGYEASDYIFLASIAKYGILGLLCFLPFYLFAYGTLVKSYRGILRARYTIFSNINILWPQLTVILATFIFYIRHLIEVPNWFYPISSVGAAPMFFIFLGLFLGANEKFRYLLNNLQKPSVPIAK